MIKWEVENGIKENTHTVKSTRAHKRKKKMLQCTFCTFCTHNPLQTLFPLKGWHSPTPLSLSPLLHSLPTPSLPLSSCPVRPPPCWEREGGTLGCDLEDRRETANYESFLMAPFIDSCLSNGSKRETPQRVPLS